MQQEIPPIRVNSQVQLPRRIPAQTLVAIAVPHERNRAAAEIEGSTVGRADRFHAAGIVENFRIRDRSTKRRHVGVRIVNQQLSDLVDRFRIDVRLVALDIHNDVRIGQVLANDFGDPVCTAGMIAGHLDLRPEAGHRRRNLKAVRRDEQIRLVAVLASENRRATR